MFGTQLQRKRPSLSHPYYGIWNKIGKMQRTSEGYILATKSPWASHRRTWCLVKEMRCVSLENNTGKFGSNGLICTFKHRRFLNGLLLMTTTARKRSRELRSTLHDTFSRKRSPQPARVERRSLFIPIPPILPPARSVHKFWIPATWPLFHVIISPYT